MRIGGLCWPIKQSRRPLHIHPGDGTFLRRKSMEVNLMNILKEEGPSIHLAVGENYLMGMEAWISQEHPHIFRSYLMSSIS